MRVYLRDYLSQSGDRKKITSAFHYFNQKNSKTGYLIGLLSVESESDFDASNVIRFVWNGIVDEFSSSDSNSIERLKKTIGSGSLKLSELLRNSPVEDAGVDLNFTLVHFVNDLIYFGSFGSSEISIFHEDELVGVSELLKKSKVEVGSTQLASDDVVFLSSEDFWKENNIKTSEMKTINTLLTAVENTKIELGGGIVMASTGVDFEAEMLKMGPEIVDLSSTILPKFLEFDNKEMGIASGVALAGAIGDSGADNASSASDDIKQQMGDEGIETKQDDESLSKGDELEEGIEEGIQDEVSETEGDETVESTQDEVTETKGDDVSELTEEESSDLIQDDEVVGESMVTNDTADDEKTNVDEMTDDVEKTNDDEMTNVDSKEIEKGIEKILDEDSPFEEVIVESSQHQEEEIKDDSESDHSIGDSEVQDVEIEGSPIRRTYVASAAFLGGAYLAVKRRISTLKPGSTYTSSPSTISDKSRNVKSWTDRYVMNQYGRKAWFKRTKAKISQQGISSPSLGDLKIGGYKQKSLRRKRFMILGAVVLVLVAGFIGMTKASQIRINMQIHKEFVAFYDEANDLLQKAEKAVGTDADSAELTLFQIEKLISENSSNTDELNEDDKDRYDELHRSVLGVSDSLNKVVVVDEEDGEFSLFFDAKIDLTEKSVPTDIATYKDERTMEHLIITDKGNRAVYKITIYDKTVEKIQDPSNVIKEPLFVDVGVDGIYIYDAQQGVIMVPFKENKSVLGVAKVLTGVTNSDFPIDNPEELAVLTQTDNLYLVDSETKSIYKSNRTSTGSYGFPSKYFTDDSINGATDFFADFSTYVTSTGEPYFNRYLFDYVNSGLVNSPWEIKGLRGSMGAITAGYTGGSLDNGLYLYDSDNERIMVFEKPNENANRHPNQILLLTQYAYRGNKSNVFENLEDIVTDSDENSLFILDGTRIWSIKLK